jgi:hypothetical protein
MRADGFPDGSIVFLNVEQVQALSPALLTYYGAWIAAVLHDARYRPGTYAAKSNAAALYAAAVERYRAASSSKPPPFWIASTAGFALGAPPSGVGFDYATIWQGAFDVMQTWNGATLKIDVDVATSRSPGSP